MVKTDTKYLCKETNKGIEYIESKRVREKTENLSRIGAIGIQIFIDAYLFLSSFR